MSLPAAQQLPTDPSTGLILPLSKSLGSQDLAKHRAMVAVELEVLAKKFDRFGWERDRGTAAHDRMLIDWMNALHDFPLAEVQAACRAAVLANPNKMPNEGHVRSEIMKARAERPRLIQPEPEPPREPRVTAEKMQEIIQEKGMTRAALAGKMVKTMPGSQPRSAAE
mgnify:CR=1 FL=1